MITLADVTQIAAVVAAATGLVAALTGIVNLGISIVRERPALRVFVRRWRAGSHGEEQYVEVIATNIAHRPTTVVDMGIRLGDTSRSWKVNDGKARPPVPVKLKDGEIVSMIWLRDELGAEFYEGTVHVVACFAVDGRGQEVTGLPPN